MALIKCPECELQVSDKAISCPHCGFPLQAQPKKNYHKSTKRMKLPNGFGSIMERKGKKLREPFYVRICVGKDPFGKPILRALKPKASFATYNEAYQALVDYNRNPYDLDNDITVAELYDRWVNDYFKSPESNSYFRTVSAAWSYCSSIYTMRVKDVRARHIKGCMDDGYRIETKGKKKGEKVFASAGTKGRIKSLFNIMLDYALENEIVMMNYARTFDTPEEIVKEKEESTRGHIIFTSDEIQTLWENVDKCRFVDWVLIQCYMGWRPQELAILRLDEVNMDEWYMCSGMKTPSGKQRVVPIHHRIKPLVQKNYDFAVSIGSEYLFNDKGQTHAGSWKLTYDKYANRFNSVIDELKLNPKHRPHDPRKTFATALKRAGADDGAIKKMIGHKIKDITESAYTERDIEWLREDIEKLK